MPQKAGCTGSNTPISLSSLNSIGQRVRVQKQKYWTDKWIKIGQTNGRNYTNFKSNLVMMVIYLPVKSEFNWTKCFSS